MYTLTIHEKNVLKDSRSRAIYERGVQMSTVQNAVGKMTCDSGERKHTFITMPMVNLINTVKFVYVTISNIGSYSNLI